MITTKLYLDTRAIKDDDPAPLKVAITKKRQAAYISLGIKLTKKQWDAKKQRIIDAPNKLRLENYIKNKMMEIENAIMDLQTKGELTKQTATQIKNKVIAYLDPEVNKKDLFINRYIEYMNSRSAQRTREIYETTLKKMRSFDSKVDTYSFEDISEAIGFRTNKARFA